MKRDKVFIYLDHAHPTDDKETFNEFDVFEVVAIIVVAIVLLIAK